MTGGAKTSTCCSKVSKLHPFVATCRMVKVPGSGSVSVATGSLENPNPPKSKTLVVAPTLSSTAVRLNGGQPELWLKVKKAVMVLGRMVRLTVVSCDPHWFVPDRVMGYVVTGPLGS